MIRLFNGILQASAMMLAAVPLALLVRLALKRAPKAFAYLLWCLVFLRLLCPATLETTRALLPSRQAVEQRVAPVLVRPLTGDAGNRQADTAPVWVPQEQAGEAAFAGVPAAGQEGGSAAELLARLWLAAAAVMVCGALAPWLRLRHRLRTAARAADGAWESDRIATPFVLGVLRPRIYLPLGLSGGQRQYVLAHERTHIRRLDPLVKLLAFAGLALHWFNPLVWLAYWLLYRDMELSCDESVLRKWPGDIRVPYAGSLLQLAARQGGWMTTLAFGESSVKQRVKHALGYKKAALGVVCAAALVVGAAGLLLMTRQKGEPVWPDAVLYGRGGAYLYAGETGDVSMLPQDFALAGRVNQTEEAAPSRARRAAYRRGEYRVSAQAAELMGNEVYEGRGQAMLYVYDGDCDTYRAFRGDAAGTPAFSGDADHTGEPAITWDGAVYWLDEQQRRFAQVPHGYREAGILEIGTEENRPVPVGCGIGQAYGGGAVYRSGDGQALLLQDRVQGGYILFTLAGEPYPATAELLLEEVRRSILLDDPGILEGVTAADRADAPEGPADMCFWSGRRVRQADVVEQQVQGSGAMQRAWARLQVTMDAATSGMVSNRDIATSVYCTVQRHDILERDRIYRLQHMRRGS